MTHPEELLAGYVDGSLSPGELAAVDAHISGCARCGRETALAARARSALRSVNEVPAPSGVATRALEEAVSARRSGVNDDAPRWYRVGGIVAAAAAALLVLTLILPRIGQNEGSGGGARNTSEDSARASGPATAMAAASAIEIRRVNYDDASLADLTSSYKSGAAGGAAGIEASPAPVVLGSPAQTAKAIACSARSAPDEVGELQSLIRARFKSTPAYLAVFLESPGAGQPADAVTVWVFAARDCRILSFSSAQL